jgi:hypothetical protein
MFQRLIWIWLLVVVPGNMAMSQDNRAWKFTGVVYDAYFRPLPYTHVVARGTGQGDVTDSLGIFTLYVRNMDRLSFYNIACHDTTVIINKDMEAFYINLREKRYAIGEARAFSWGSTYGEFLQEYNRQGVPETMGEALELPQQDEEIKPFDMDEKRLKSVGFLVSSPVSFLYYNLSKREKSARKAFQLEQDKELIELYESILSRGNLGYITGLKEEALEDFVIYLNDHLQCSYKCPELKLLTEIHDIWNRYKEVNGL